jgi:hypothetical protein
VCLLLLSHSDFHLFLLFLLLSLGAKPEEGWTGGVGSLVRLLTRDAHGGWVFAGMAFLAGWNDARVGVGVVSLCTDAAGAMWCFAAVDGLAVELALVTASA